MCPGKILVMVGRLVETLRVKFLNIQKALRNKVRLRGVTILESGGATTNRRMLNPAQGPESGKDGGEVRAMTYIRV